ncbi:MAG: peptide chain release factor N(5)-glutamine methyltransferase [Emcibacteraceae bacterium]|nr:peptide chain release factor N(5)-glutamine methyltransferase [Emcibacteraceae bacterium]MDG1726597.1 peptide chain release factor N(5)-glutamine methyltransferase [Emcibacteraceae bacterium]
MDTLATLRKKIEARLRKKGIEEAPLDARLLISHIIPVTEIDFAINADQIVSNEQQNLIDILVQKREKRIPMSQIFGEKEFWSLSFKVTRDTLTPRPDSETLIEVALNEFEDKNATLSILDLGTGSGCLLLTLLSELKNATGLGIDVSASAIKVANENATNLSLNNRATFLKSDWFEKLFKTKKFDLIIANPPYIGLNEKPELTPEVCEHEPYSALFAGEEGLDDYRIIAADISSYMSEKSIIILEIGYRQSSAVKDIFEQKGFKNINVFQDLGGRDRCLLIRP